MVGKKKRKKRQLKSRPLADIQLALIERSTVKATALVKNSPMEKNLWCYLYRVSHTMLLGESGASGTGIEMGSVEVLCAKLIVCFPTSHQHPRHCLQLTSSPMCIKAEFLERTSGVRLLWKPSQLWGTNTTKIQAAPSLSHGVTLARVPVLQTHDHLSSSSSARKRHCRVRIHWAMHMLALEMMENVLFLHNNVFPKRKIWKLKNVGWYFWESEEIT